jgi:hypothetical protein
VQQWARDILQHWTRGKIAGSGRPDDEDLMGRCPTCEVLRRRREVTQAERDEVCCYLQAVKTAEDAVREQTTLRRRVHELVERLQAVELTPERLDDLGSYRVASFRCS